mmetsp:Transcript_1091/g.2527  ORF Transcript_1091/g.2527 Transcript_1091/m.2527 type:complete len:294 (-) Transcript_1091:319-1200(-)
MANVTAPVLRFNLFDFISMICDSVIIKKDSSKRPRVELVIFRSIAPAPANPAFATCSPSVSCFFFSFDSADLMASSANLGRRIALQEYTPWQSTHGASSMLISSPIRTSDAVAFGRALGCFFRPRRRLDFFLSPFSPPLFARFRMLMLKDDPSFFALVIASLTSSDFVAEPISTACIGSPCDRLSLILSAMFKTASDRCKLGVQSSSTSMHSPSLMVDPAGNFPEPVVRMADGFRKGKETADASTEPSAFFFSETSNVTVMGSDFVVSDSVSDAPGRSRRHVRVQFPFSMSRE